MDDFKDIGTACGYVAFTSDSEDKRKNGLHFCMDPNLAMDFARRLAVMAREAGATNLSEDSDSIDAELFHP